MYNDTLLWDANNLYEIGTQFNNLVGGIYFVLSMLLLFILYMAVFKKQEFKPVFVIGSFGISIISIIMFINGYIGYQFVLVPIISFFASIIIFYFVQKS